MFPELIISVIIAAFVLEFLDASIGMGYGEITALLLLMGFMPLEIIPAVLLTSAVMSLIAGYLHHDFDNVDFSFKKKNKNGFKTKISNDLKISLVLTLFGIVGVIIGALLAVRLPELILRIYIGTLVSVIGVMILLKYKKCFSFSWKKIIGLGSFAAFNKGMTGGGYGPVLAGGQIVSGVDSKKAVAITALTEGLVCVVGFGAYIMIGYFGGMGVNLNWPLIISLLIGGVASTPLAVLAVKRLPAKVLRNVVGVVGIILGLLILGQLVF
jgi:uncharacterized protein